MQSGRVNVLSFGGFELDVMGPELRRAGEVVPLRPKSLALVCYLAQRPGRLVRKEDLIDAVWQGVAVTDATLSRTLFEAREALGDDPRQPRFIATVHRVGFRFVGEETGGPSPAVEGSAPGIVGRAGDLRALDDWRAAAAAGRRQVVFVTGEAGVGKTSVLEAFLDTCAAAPGWLVGRGQCIEHYGVGEAYLPLLDAIGELCHGAAGASTIALLRHVAPSWLGQFPWLVEERDRPGLERLLREVAPERMMRELAQALETLSAEYPLVLALEDLHWCDAATADLIAFLARRSSVARLMVIATYRPVEAILAENPIRIVHHDLRPQNRCRSLAIEALLEVDVGALVGARFGASPFAADLAALVHRRTEGNPLFAVSLLDDLVTQGHIAAAGGEWQLAGDLSEIESTIPEDLRQMVQVQYDRLAPGERDAARAASVAGIAFSSAEVAAALSLEVVAAEELCESVARRGIVAAANAATAWPDGTAASAYVFRHALYRDSIYAEIPAARRGVLHQRIGERLARAHAAAPAVLAGRLAMHFSAARDDRLAASYFRQAAEVAARRGAPREALLLADKARAHLERWPEGVERNLEELLLGISAGPALAATLGYAAPQVERTFTRARELVRELGDGAPLFPVLWGLWAFRAVRGQIDTALDMAQQCLTLAEQSEDRDLLLEAHHALWVTHFFRGDFSAAQAHLDAGLPLYDRAHHHAHVMLFGQDPAVVGLAYRSLVSLARGQARDALEQSAAAIALGRDLGHPVSLVFALHFGAWMHEQRGDGDRCRELAEEVLEISTAHALTFWHAHATWFVARARAADAPAASATGMRVGMDALRATGAGMGLPAYLTTLARTHFEMGAVAEAQRLVDEASALAAQTGDGLTRSEQARLRGDIELAHSSKGTARDVTSKLRAEAFYREAIEVARHQQALGLELRGALSLATLLVRAERADEIQSLLRPLLDRLVADADFPEIHAARQLLAAPSLGKKASSPRSRAAKRRP